MQKLQVGSQAFEYGAQQGIVRTTEAAVAYDDPFAEEVVKFLTVGDHIDSSGIGKVAFSKRVELVLSFVVSCEVVDVKSLVSSCRICLLTYGTMISLNVLH